MTRITLTALFVVVPLGLLSRAAGADEEMCARGECGPPQRWCGPGEEAPGRFAVGIAHGHIAVDGGGEGNQGSLFGRVRLHHGLAVELELARAELDDGREERTAGVALERFFRRDRHLSPYLALGGGGGMLERADGSEGHAHYGEVGLGLMLRARRFAIAFDVHAGIRRSEEEAGVAAAVPEGATARQINPTDETAWEHHRYHRARLMALFHF